MLMGAGPSTHSSQNIEIFQPRSAPSGFSADEDNEASGTVGKRQRMPHNLSAHAVTPVEKPVDIAKQSPTPRQGQKQQP